MQRPPAPPQGRVTPKQDGVYGIEVGGWKITSTNKRILNSVEKEQLQEELEAPELPEMVFGHSKFELLHTSSGVMLRFDALGALKGWDKNAPSLKVAYSSEWARTRDTSAKSIAKEFDWTFTTHYKGDIVPQPSEGSRLARLEPTEEKIDLEKLKKPDPILWFDEVVLFEDELADNGTAFLTVKVRVMPRSFYCLMRFWMRLDDVLFRVHDTRLYHEFGWKYVLREYQTREDTYKHLKQIGKFPTDPSKLADSHVVAPLLPITSETTEKIWLAEGASASSSSSS
ncbi:Tap42 interacting protein [Balamuthia mandrillaris]